jgi:amino acid adenylation domain-containing protein
VNHRACQRPKTWVNIADYAQYDIVLMFKPLESCTQIDLNFSLRTLSKDQASSVLAALQKALFALTKHPRQSIAEADLLGDYDLDRIFTWNKDWPEFVQTCAQEIFKQRADSQPGATALVCGDFRLTYRELDDLSTRLAHHLVGLGVAPESIVPLCFEKSPWAIVSMLGAIKAGGAIVFLDPAHPASRLEEILSQTQAKLVVSSENTSGLWESSDVQVFIVTEKILTQLRPHSQMPDCGVRPENMLYVVFTSGSTGKPKGCVVEHRQFLSGALQHAARSHITPSTRILQLASYTFDVSILEIITSLIAGACIFVPDEQTMSKGIPAAMNSLGITWTFLTPSVVKLIKPEDISSLKTLILGGEPLSKVDIETWSERVHLINGYGPSECSIAAAANDEITSTTDPANIGRAVGGMCWIVDPRDHNRLVPTGVIGELLISGPIVARGYLNNPEKTAEVFLENPTWMHNVSHSKHKRIYKTGDLAKFNADGTIHFIGRKDTQVKMRGQRLELGEIEHHISVHERTKHTIVLLPKSGSCKGKLVAVVSLRDLLPSQSKDDELRIIDDEERTETALTQVDSIRNALSGLVPGYMMPTVWVVVERIPLLSSAKMNRPKVAKWITEMDDETYCRTIGLQEEEDVDAVMTEMEKLFQSVFSQVLNLPLHQIGLNKSFLAIGGDSILAMQLMARCREKGVDVTVKEVLTSKSLSQLAAVARPAQAGLFAEEEENSYPPFALMSVTEETLGDLLQRVQRQTGIINVEMIENVYPCSPVQQGMLLGQVKTPGSYQYSNTIKISPSSHGVAVDVQRLSEAWRQVVKRHAALRTILVEMTGYVQVVLRELEPRVTDNSDGNEIYLGEKEDPTIGGPRPPHRLIISKTPDGAVVCKLEINHAVVDGESLLLILRDVVLAYDGLLPQTPAPVFSDYVGYLVKGSTTSSLDYWKTYLGDITPCHVRFVQEEAERRDWKRVGLDMDLNVTRLNAVSNQYGVTLSNIIQAAWGLVLRQYTGSDDVCFGYMSSGRDAPVAGIQEIVGAFMSILTCRLNLSKERSLENVLKDSSKDFANSLSNQHCSLAEIQHALHTSGRSLFNTLMSLQRDTTESQSEASHLKLESLDEESPTEYDIAVSVRVFPQRIQVYLGYWGNSVSDDLVAGISSTFAKALSYVLENANATIQELDLISNEDRKQISAWNKKLPLATDACVHELFTRQAQSQPDASAISSWDRNLTYGELDDLSSRLAHYLINLGVGPEKEVKVPLCFDKSAWTIVAMLAVLKAGGSFACLSPTYPKRRMKEILDAVDARFVLVGVQHVNLFADFHVHTLAVEASLFEHLPAAHPIPARAKPSDLACIIFTSGSTGQPKGILIEHRALCSSMMAHGAQMGFNKSRVLQFAAYTFDVSNGEIFTTLLHGGCVCIPSETERMDDLAGAMDRHSVTLAVLCPSVFIFIDPKDVPTLKNLIFGGEPVPQQLIPRWADKLDLRNVYGPSECCILCTNSPLTPSSRATTIGRAVGSLSWIVDPKDHHRLSAIGCVGELLIEGPLLARAYLNDDEKTSGAFIEDPAWASWGASSAPRRFYKTGDLVRYNNDGTLEYISRRDTQIKLHGQRIELGEVEHHLGSQLPDARQVAVEIVAPGAGNQTLAAFIDLGMSDSGDDSTECIATLLTDELQSHFIRLQTTLSGLLPSYMVPSMYITMRKMPQLPSGKLDRKVLRQVAAELPEAQLVRYSLAAEDKRAPSTPMEKQLQALWTEVLGVTEIGADDSFFRLGGDSITAMRLVTAAHAVGIPLSVALIFRQPQLSAMALGIGEGRGMIAATEEVRPFGLLPRNAALVDMLEEAAALCGIQPDQIADIYPCTPLQEGLMAIASHQEGAYAARLIFRLPHTLPSDPFRDAWQKTADAHPILRTRIVHAHAGSMQVVLQPEQIAWQKAFTLDEYLQTDKEVPMHHGGALLRYGLADDGSPEGRYFVLSAHHAVYDGYSIGLIYKQVEEMFKNDFVAPVPSFTGFLAHLAASNEAEAAEYWRKQLAESRPSSFPQLPSTSYQVRVNQRQQRSMQMSRSGSSILTSTILRAAWAMLMSRYSEADDVVIGVTLSGRNAPVAGISQMLGPTITTVPVRIALDDRKQSVADYLNSVQDQATQMIPYEHTGLQNIRRFLDSKDAQQALDFKNLFLVQPSAETGGHAGFLGTEMLHTVLEGFDSFALVVECTLEESKVDMEIRYDANVIPSLQISWLLGQFEHVVRQLSDVPDKPLRQIDFVSPQDRTQLLEWNNSNPESVEACIHELFSTQAKKTPKAPAICAWDGEFTYAELDSLSNRLAQHLLKEYAVVPDMKVLLCFDKSAWAVIAMLAVFKAGGASTAVSPNYPRRRMGEVASIVGARLILASPQHRHLVDGLVSKTVFVERALLDQLPAVHHDLVPTSKPSNAAFVGFTSGSTGQPKGIVIQHNSFLTNILAHGPVVGHRNTSRVFQFAAYVFDVSNGEMFATLLHGGCVCVPSEAERQNDLAAAMRRMEVNLAYMTPSVASMLDSKEVPSLKGLIVGGERLPQQLIQNWAGVVNLVNIYGPTECSIWSTAVANVSIDASGANIGRPMGSNTWIAEPDDHNKLCGLGSVGELLIQGPIVSKEYLRDPVKTATAFISAPSWLPKKMTHRRLYKTGDLARYNPDGSIDFIGRKDTQIKLHGQRIELGEIEYHLMTQMPGIRQGAVELIKTGPSQENQLLAAFIHLDNPEDEQAPDTSLLPLSKELQSQLSKLQESLAGVMPSYMVPSLYMPMRGMPKMTTGKLDRPQLRQLGSALSVSEVTRYSLSDVTKRPPASPLEKQLQILWAQVLGITDLALIGADDSFLRLGGDSISAMRLVSAAQIKGLAISVAGVFRNPVLSAMAELLENGSVSPNTGKDLQPFELIPGASVEAVLEEASSLCHISRDHIEDIYPCTPLQEGLMAITTRQEGAYVKRMAFRMPSTMDVHFFKGAWQRVYGLNPILRTRIVQSQTAGSLQVVIHDEQIVWKTAKTLEEYLDGESRASMTPGDRLTRYGLVGEQSEDQPKQQSRYFIWTAHHAIYDGWSIALLAKQLEHIFTEGAAPALPPFNGFLGYLATIGREALTKYWLSQLSGPGVPSSFPQLPSAAYVIRADQKTHFPLQMPRQRGSEIMSSTVLRAAWALVMARYTESEDVVFGATLSGRNAPVNGIAQMLGPTISTVPVRLTLNKDQQVHEYLKAVQRQATDMIPFEHIGLQHIRRLLSENRQDVSAIDFKNLFVVQSAAETGERADFFGLEALQSELEEYESYALAVECRLHESGHVDVVVQHDPVVLPHAQLQWLLGQFEHVVHQFSTANSSQRALHEVDLFSSQDRMQVFDWNKAKPTVINSCVHDIVKVRADERMDALAVCSWDADLTYRKLDSLSLRLAHHLVSLGVGPEVTVPFCFDKSAYAVISMLAILRAGGACTALSPAYPRVRIGAIVGAVGARVILASPQYVGLFQDLVPHAVGVSSELLGNLLATNDEAPLAGRATPNTAAFVAWTSGSTGKPKGIVLEHKAICSSSIAYGGVIGLKPSFRVLQFSAYTFDVSVGEVFATLIHGGCVCVPSEDNRMDDLAGTMTRLQVQMAVLTPTVVSNIRPEDVPYVETLLLAGEKLRKELVDIWSYRVNLINGYVSCLPTSSYSLMRCRSDVTRRDQLSVLCALLRKLESLRPQARSTSALASDAFCGLRNLITMIS